MPDQGDPDDGSEDAPASGSADEPTTDDADAEDAGGATGGDVGAGGTGGGGGNGGAGGGGGNGGGGRGGLGPDEQYCSSCGEPIKKEAEICPHCGVRNKSASSDSGSGGSRKDRTTAGILALLLGGIGAHKFYLNDTGLGLLYLCFSWTLIPAVIGFIEGIIYLTKTDEEFERQYVN
jgi:TM2 domain-containing membrane protein YozV